jgi:hypothetical protein
VKLPIPASTVDEAVAEFDIWITASLGELRDTERFAQEMEAVVSVFEALAIATNDFADKASCRPDAIADTYVQLLRGDTSEGARTKLEALGSVLFLVTAKSDNNSKCQLPIYLRDNARWEGVPVVKRSRLSMAAIPRVLKLDKYMAMTADLSQYPDEQRKMLTEFISFVLSDDKFASQLWSVGRSYVTLKALAPGSERDLLSPLVAFQVRGSVTASGGHDPEDLLRRRLEEWGLEPGIDFNTNDVVVAAAKGVVNISEEGDGKDAQAQKEDDGDGQNAPPQKAEVATRQKTRAYDFVFPFRTAGWQPRIFVQCQFYAGDSGSVSHKNVDQTSTSRRVILEGRPDALFIEYVDGAGYFSSLNGDLRRLLEMPTTRSFIQVRSAAVRLRRELGGIGLLVPLEIEHAVIRTSGRKEDVTPLLLGDGYSEHEAIRAIESAVRRGLLTSTEDTLSLRPDRREVARRYLLLDVAVLGGRVLDPHRDVRGSGFVLVPGHGPFWGIELDRLAERALALAPGLSSDWTSPTVFPQDVRWLCDQGLAMLG